MIPYEELCQTLDRFNARRRNAAELNDLDQVREPAAQPTPVPTFGPEEVRHTDEVAVLPSDQGFAEQKPEDTHEIDVDDVVVDERLSEDKIPGE